MFEKSFLRSTRPTLRHICTEFSQRSTTTPSSFGTNLPQSVTHISQKAFFKHALEIIELSNSNIDGFDAHKLVFTYNGKGQEFTRMQYSLAEGVRFHEFRYTYLTEMKESYEEKIEKIINTIKFLKE